MKLDHSNWKWVLKVKYIGIFLIDTYTGILQKKANTMRKLSCQENILTERSGIYLIVLMTCIGNKLGQS